MSIYLPFAFSDIESPQNEIKCDGIKAVAVELGAHGRGVRIFIETYVGRIFVLSCVSHELDGWEEVGTLMFALASAIPLHTKTVEINERWRHIFNVEKLTIQSGDFFAESGICIFSMAGEEICIVSGVMPETVEIVAPGWSNDFNPEFDLGQYIRSAMV